jgi:hypothetical protein
MLIFFEHGRTSIKDYVLLEILVEIIQESLEDYLQSAGQNHFTCNRMCLVSNYYFLLYISTNFSNTS